MNPADPVAVALQHVYRPIDAGGPTMEAWQHEPATVSHVVRAALGVPELDDIGDTVSADVDLDLLPGANL